MQSVDLDLEMLRLDGKVPPIRRDEYVLGPTLALVLVVVIAIVVSILG